MKKNVLNTIVSLIIKRILINKFVQIEFKLKIIEKRIRELIGIQKRNIYGRITKSFYYFNVNITTNKL